MRRIAALTLGASAAFLSAVAVLINAPGLFYMGTALVATIAASRLQAWLSVRGLRFERVAPDAARIGEIVKVEIIVWSERKIRRPLVTVRDNLPPRLMVSELSPSLPVAPDFETPIRTEYGFRPLRRGKFRWSGLTAVGTDALGLVSMSKKYTTEVAELTVLPSPIPVNVELPSATGFGVSEESAGQAKGAGVETRGVREYTTGDSIRHIHWRSSARTGQLQVKEFEAGSHSCAVFILQRTQGTDLGHGELSSLDLMCGHAIYLAETFMRQGAQVTFPQFLEDPPLGPPAEQLAIFGDHLASAQGDDRTSMGMEILALLPHVPRGGVVFGQIVVADDSILAAAAKLREIGSVFVPLLYNAAHFAGKGRAPSVRNAIDGDFVDALRSAGAYPVLMPGVAS